MLRVYKLVAVAGPLALLLVVLSVRWPNAPVFVPPAGAKPGPVRILRFYASAGMLVTGEKAQLCYGVINAKSVRIAPLLTALSPSTGRCLEIGPKHTTHYTILAEGFDGRMAVQSLTLPVQAPADAPVPRVNYATW